MIKDHPKQYEIWIADMNPPVGSEPGKIRPVVIVQTNLLNKTGHSSFIACSVSSQSREEVSLLRISVEPSGYNGLLKRSFIICDQMRTLDITRLKNRIGVLDGDSIGRLRESLQIILDL